MAKRKNFPKPLFFNADVLNYYREKFLKYLRINFFSNQYVIVSDNCAVKNIPFLLGELNGICVNEWQEEKEVFHSFIISDSDYENAVNGLYSKEVDYVLKNINKRQTLKDEDREKISADIFIIKESDFLEFHKDRKAFIENHFSLNSFSEEDLFRYAASDNNVRLF